MIVINIYGTVINSGEINISDNNIVNNDFFLIKNTNEIIKTDNGTFKIKIYERFD